MRRRPPRVFAPGDSPASFGESTDSPAVVLRWSPRLHGEAPLWPLSDDRYCAREGAYLRREGLHSTQLEAWRHAMLESLSDANSPAKRHSADRRRAKKEAERIRALERDLDRKNKALAEVTALLALQKKSRRSGGTGTTARDRRTRPDPRTCRRGHARRRQPGRCGRVARRTATNPSALAQARHRRGPSGRTKGTTRQQAHGG